MRSLVTRAWFLVGLFVVAVAVWLLLLIYVGNKASQERDRLCLVMYALINRSGEQIGRPGSPGYAYYQAHPDEREKARAQNKDFLRALPCEPRPAPPPLRTGEEDR